MKKPEVSKASLGRMPMYLELLKELQVKGRPTVSAPVIAKALGLGEVQVRKDLCAVSGAGKPRIGYVTDELIHSVESFLGFGQNAEAVLLGAGKLGKALLDYSGFTEYGLNIVAAFDKACDKTLISESGKPIYPISTFEGYCQKHPIQTAIITVPVQAAQEVCDMAVRANIKAIWNFAAIKLEVPDGVNVQNENLALSLAYLNKQK